jgi:hypothetical protein
LKTSNFGLGRQSLNGVAPRRFEISRDAITAMPDSFPKRIMNRQVPDQLPMLQVLTVQD